MSLDSSRSNGPARKTSPTSASADRFRGRGRTSTSASAAAKGKNSCSSIDSMGSTRSSAAHHGVARSPRVYSEDHPHQPGRCAIRVPTMGCRNRPRAGAVPGAGTRRHPLPRGRPLRGERRGWQCIRAEVVGSARRPQPPRHRISAVTLIRDAGSQFLRTSARAGSPCHVKDLASNKHASRI